MENQALSSSSNSSTPKPKKLKSPVVAIEESKEKTTRNNNLKLGSPQEVASQRRLEMPSFGSDGSVRRGNKIMTFYPPGSNKIYTCRFCQEWFTDSRAFGGHQNAHRQERMWEKKRKEMEADSSEHKPHILLGGYVLSNENDHGITFGPLKRFVYPFLNNGGLVNVRMAVDPGMTPTRFIIGNTITNHFPSKGPGPFNNMYPYIPRKNLPFPPPPPRTSSNLVPQENVLSEEKLIPKIETNNDEEIDDEDQTEEDKFTSWGKDLSLSL